MSAGSQAEGNSSPIMDNDYPPQHHAGVVGYGPNFSVSASLSDKISGLTEEIRGKITHHPELVREGHDKKSGEIKRRKALGLDEGDSVFGSGQEDKSSETSSRASEAPKSEDGERSGVPTHSMPGTKSTTDPGRMAANAHTSEEPAKEQAATVAPEGTDLAQQQRGGDTVKLTKDVDAK